MIKDEFKFIGKNKLILLSVLVITLIPFLYCIFFFEVSLGSLRRYQELASSSGQP